MFSYGSLRNTFVNKIPVWIFCLELRRRLTWEFNKWNSSVCNKECRLDAKIWRPFAPEIHSRPLKSEMKFEVTRIWQNLCEQFFFVNKTCETRMRKKKASPHPIENAILYILKKVFYGRFRIISIFILLLFIVAVAVVVIVVCIYLFQ